MPAAIPAIDVAVACPVRQTVRRTAAVRYGVSAHALAQPVAADRTTTDAASARRVARDRGDRASNARWQDRHRRETPVGARRSYAETGRSLAACNQSDDAR